MVDARRRLRGARSKRITCDQSSACVTLCASSTRLLMKLRGMAPSTLTLLGNKALVVEMRPRLFQPHALPLSCPGYVYLVQQRDGRVGNKK
jgi:hypothetical protein